MLKLCNVRVVEWGFGAFTAAGHDDSYTVLEIYAKKLPYLREEEGKHVRQQMVVQRLVVTVERGH